VEGIDIMLCMDVSTSMLAEDLKPNRIEAAKKVAIEFVSGRPDDNIGLTVFAGEAYTQCPMTVDHAALLNMLNGMRVDMAQRGLIEDGTAIGMGIANAITRLKDSKAKSKVIILLTDGTNNRGQISPNTAADIAKTYGIRVYTIGVGTNGTAPYPVSVAGRIEYMNVPLEIDSKTLATIAAKTDGEFYRAQNTEKLREVYQQIDKLEKTKMNVKKFSKKYESFGIFALISVIALMLELLLRKTLLKRIP
jgi:Ca-activated chloride channel family protein